MDVTLNLKSVSVISIKAGEKISLRRVPSGKSNFGAWPLENNNGTLVDSDATIDWTTAITYNWKGDALDSYVALHRSGYYLLYIPTLDLTRSDHRTPPSAETMYFVYVQGGTATDSKTTAPATETAPEKPAATTKPDATSSAPSAPATASANTVTVAGTQRTPGQLQQYSNGYIYTVSYGDTLYDLAAHFYGDGNLWGELQAVNQENLNETVNGQIFVGFNLILPNELGGVSIG
jgi:nucleoid-associated protein YgaU